MTPLSPELQAIVEQPDWPNAETCIENMRIAYDDALEADPFDDGSVVPVDTMVDVGDLGVLIGLARYAVEARDLLAALSPSPLVGEEAAWAWLDSKFLNVEAGDDPNDRDYGADDMVDAFIAGSALSHPPTVAAQAPSDGEDAVAAERGAKEPYWLDEAIRRAGACPYCGALGGVGSIEARSTPIEAEARVKVLERYVEHDSACGINTEVGCTCGLDAALASSTNGAVE